MTKEHVWVVEQVKDALESLLGRPFTPRDQDKNVIVSKVTSFRNKEKFRIVVTINTVDE